MINVGIVEQERGCEGDIFAARVIFPLRPVSRVFLAVGPRMFLIVGPRRARADYETGPRYEPSLSASSPEVETTEIRGRREETSRSAFHHAPKLGLWKRYILQMALHIRLNRADENTDPRFPSQLLRMHSATQSTEYSTENDLMHALRRALSR